ncbi:MAG TPA: lipid-A-disaccharide synthase [Elusimicrobia bacterium]|nr:MAG: lipid-A-disaccharide synthase [Elusimicrobia bacterium GWA2_66_18]OGR72605.1 MAG: lipid-A-disaccharide synthase [Elusimicrobia bacterium GWC2_65_9]HAZ07268.1 lipid-A-disaccharide synthase [Elusimicrobiota bacterium]
MSGRLILVVAGDPSGDLHASNLIKALKRRDPAVRVAAVGGPLCRAVADEFLEDLASRGVTGFWEPVLNIPFLLELRSRLQSFIQMRRPDALICVDYYGFNRRILPMAQAARVPAFYFVSPQVWASRPGRVKILKKLVKKMLVIFPFEEKLYREANVPVEFVGHPLLDLIPEPAQRARDLDSPVIGLLPGSRSSEIERHLPVFYEAFRLLRESRPNMKGLLFAAASQPDSAYGALPTGVGIVREQDYRLRATLDLALCSSGTATLENALLGVPMVVVYKLSWPTYAIARALVKVKHIAMANLLAGRGVVPELIQSEATAERTAREAARFLGDAALHVRVHEELLAIRRSLGEPGCADRAAKVILSESA